MKMLPEEPKDRLLNIRNLNDFKELASGSHTITAFGRDNAEVIFSSQLILNFNQVSSQDLEGVKNHLKRFLLEWYKEFVSRLNDFSANNLSELSCFFLHCCVLGYPEPEKLLTLRPLTEKYIGYFRLPFYNMWDAIIYSQIGDCLLPLWQTNFEKLIDDYKNGKKWPKPSIELTIATAFWGISYTRNREATKKALQDLERIGYLYSNNYWGNWMEIENGLIFSLNKQYSYEDLVYIIESINNTSRKEEFLKKLKEENERK